MKKQIVTFLIISLMASIQLVNGQAEKKKLPRNINMLGYDHFGPAISGDGNSMIYMSNYTNDGKSAIMYTKKINASSWEDPVELPRIINIPHLTYLNGYCLNFDGTEFYFTFKKSGGLGGFDIWRSNLQSGSWSSAQNLGSPLNSSLNDGSPSISSDGKTLYFMSCESMTNDTASGCKLMMTTRKSTKSAWQKPYALPKQINQGNAQSPNILADGETLMYLSDHEGSMQWYISRMEGGDWIVPQKMDFMETNKQRNISVSAKGRYVFHDVMGERGSFIEQLLIPEEFKPKDVLRIIGTVESIEGGNMKVYDVENRERIVFETLVSGDSYDFVLKEGHIYDVSFETNNKQMLFASEIFDLMEMKFSTRKKWNAYSQELIFGDSLEMKSLMFDTVTLSIASQSVYEFRRLTRFLLKNQDSKYDVNIYHYPLDTAVIAEPISAIDATIYNQYIEADTATLVSVEGGMDSLVVELDTLVYTDDLVVVPPTLAENLAMELLNRLMDKNIQQDQCSVNGMTIPIKEFEGNEALADQVIVYIKKRR